MCNGSAQGQVSGVWVPVMLSVLPFTFSTSHLAGLDWAERGERLERRLANRKERKIPIRDVAEWVLNGAGLTFSGS